MQKTIITSETNQFTIQNLKEIWNYRELLWLLSWRDIRIKYSQTFIGSLWALLNPIITLIILNLVFGKIAQVKTGAVPHIVFTMAGIISWNYFVNVVTESGSSFINSQEMIKKIYFPRVIIPLSKALNGLIELSISILLMIALLVIYQVKISYNIIYFPIFLAFTIMAGMAGGIWISALSVRYRDFYFIIPYLLRLGLYASPIAFPIQSIPDNYSILFFINPLTGIIHGAQWSLFGYPFELSYFFISVLLILFLFFSGLFFFQKTEQIITDIL